LSELDSPGTYSRKPYREAFRVTGEFVEDLRRGLELGRSLDLSVDYAERVLFIGIGGSGIVCDITARMISEKGFHAEVLRSYSFREGDWDLVIAVSHSGNTAETIKPVLRLLDRGARCTFITSGGMLAKLAERYEVPAVIVRGDFPTRYCFANMIGAALGIAELLGFMKIKLSCDELAEFRSKIAEDVPLEENPAKILARRIAESFPIVYAYDEVRYAGYRLKCQLNENAKMYCAFAELPEALHNDLEALPEDSLIILPRSFKEGVEVKETIDAFTSLVGGEKIFSVRAESRDELEELLELFLFMDYASLYVAVLRKADPLEVPRMTELKRINRVYQKVLREAEMRIAGR